MKVPESIIDSAHRDFSVLDQVKNALNDAAGSRHKLESEIPALIRRGLWEVIDTPRTSRIWVDELEKTEKTYIGTKIEILIRDYFGFSKGKLDLRIGDFDVDVKNTVRQNWMIPTEALGNVCLLVAENDRTDECWFGLIVARREYLNPGKNKDSKRSIARAELSNVLWLIRDGRMPENFWASVSEVDIVEIMDSRSSGTERLRRLFSKLQGIPISRDVVEGVARQKDYMKRLRKNGGARDALANLGIALLSGAYHSSVIKSLGLPLCTRDQFIACEPKTQREKKLLKSKSLL